MKANELMIGDWVRISFSDAVKVKELTYDKDKSEYVAYCSNLQHYYCADLMPVPLLNGILEKNGFFHNPSFKDDPMRFVIVAMRGQGILWEGMRDCIYGLHYVHELQHALRLCGIEKEVVL